jgi:hypothetical protein
MNVGEKARVFFQIICTNGEEKHYRLVPFIPTVTTKKGNSCFTILNFDYFVEMNSLRDY